MERTSGVGDTHRHVLLLAEETHSDVVPERGAFWDSRGYDPVLGEGNIEVPVGLHHAACRQDGLKPRTQESVLSPSPGLGRKEPQSAGTLCRRQRAQLRLPPEMSRIIRASCCGHRPTPRLPDMVPGGGGGFTQLASPLLLGSQESQDCRNIALHRASAARVHTECPSTSETPAPATPDPFLPRGEGEPPGPCWFRAEGQTQSYVGLLTC